MTEAAEGEKEDQRGQRRWWRLVWQEGWRQKRLPAARSKTAEAPVVFLMEVVRRSCIFKVE